MFEVRDYRRDRLCMKVKGQFEVTVRKFLSSAYGGSRFVDFGGGLDK